MPEADGTPLTDDAVRHALAVYESARRVSAADVVAAAGEAADHPDPRHARAVVLAFAAHVEADTHLRKRLALACEEAGRVRFSPAQRAVLDARLYSLNRRGDPVEAPQHQPLVPDLRFSLQMLARSFGVPFAELVNGAGWSALLRVLLVAARLRRPACAADLDVAGPEMDSLAAAAAWYEQTASALVQKATGPPQAPPGGPRKPPPTFAPARPLVRLPPLPARLRDGHDAPAAGGGAKHRRQGAGARGLVGRGA
jgi:hypothetical protein